MPRLRPAGCAARTPSPTGAHDKAANGIASYHPWANRVEEARRRAGQLLNADPLDVCFVRSTTHGIGVVAEGFPWKPGDNVVLAAEEYPANQYPWMNLARPRRRGAGRCRAAAAGSTSTTFAAAMDARTRVLTVQSVEFASGFRNDLDALGELCRERGVFFFVDAIQSLGRLSARRAADPDRRALGRRPQVAARAGRGGHRLHPPRVGRPAAPDRRRGEQRRPGRATSRTIDFTLKPHAGRWEGGTFNVPRHRRPRREPGIAARMPASTNIEDRVIELTDYLCERRSVGGGKVFSSREPAEKSGIVSLVDARPRAEGDHAAVPGGRRGRERPRRPRPRQPARLQHGR